jgi:pimeloyl-[acyl-carrier protein] synthase
MTPLTELGPLIEEQLQSPHFVQDPYPTYRLLRENHPVYWSEAWKCWVLTRHADVAAMLKEPARFSSAGRLSALIDQLPPDQRSRYQPMRDHFSRGLIHCDPPDHTRLRKLIGMAFTQRVIEKLRARVDEIIAQNLAAQRDASTMDVMKDLAFPLPTIVIAEMLGAPPEDREKFKAWTTGIVAFQGTGKPKAEMMDYSQDSLLQMRAYVRSLCAERRKQPREDLLSLLVAAEDAGDKLTEEELIGTCVTLFIAGHETTTGLIANAVAALLRHPEQLQMARENPARMADAIEETLRWDNSVQRVFRRVAQDTEFAGQKFLQNQTVVGVIGAANRDPEVFADPERFDIIRTGNRHIAFGSGVHFCLGAPLARLEAPMAVNKLLREFPNARLANPTIDWLGGGLFRYPKSLPILLR